MRMKCLLLLLMVGLTTQAIAQTAEDSVKATINKMFAAMKDGDGTAFKAAFADSAVLQTITRTKEGRTLVKTDGVAEFAGFVSKLKKDSADERINFEAVKIDGPLAIAWTPYKFYYNGSFSHCGVNSFQLVRFEGVWKIQYLIDTRRRAGCQP